MRRIRAVALLTVVLAMAPVACSDDDEPAETGAGAVTTRAEADAGADAAYRDHARTAEQAIADIKRRIVVGSSDTDPARLETLEARVVELGGALDAIGAEGLPAGSGALDRKAFEDARAAQEQLDRYLAAGAAEDRPEMQRAYYRFLWLINRLPSADTA